MAVAQHPSAYPQHQGAVALHQGREGALVTPPVEALQEQAVRHLRGRVGRQFADAAEQRVARDVDHVLASGKPSRSPQDTVRQAADVFIFFPGPDLLPIRPRVENRIGSNPLVDHA
jgi:hypothetical protein